MSADEVHEIACTCCDKTLRISDDNLQRIGRAAAFALPNGTALDIGTIIRAGVDWTADVNADVIARVVVQAADYRPGLPGHPVRRR